MIWHCILGRKKLKHFYTNPCNTSYNSLSSVLLKSWLHNFGLQMYAHVTYMALYLVGHGTTYFHNIADDIGAYFSSVLSNLHNAWLRMPWLHVFSEISSLAHHNPHINAIFVYLLVQELFVDKIYFFMFLSVSDKPRLHQLKIIISTCKTVQASLAVWFFPSVQGNTIKEGKYSVLRTNTKPHQLIKYAKISYSIVSLVFQEFSSGTYGNSLNRGTSKLRHTKYLKKYKLCLIPFVNDK